MSWVWPFKGIANYSRLLKGRGVGPRSLWRCSPKPNATPSGQRDMLLLGVCC